MRTSSTMSVLSSSSNYQDPVNKPLTVCLPKFKSSTHKTTSIMFFFWHRQHLARKQAQKGQSGKPGRRGQVRNTKLQRPKLACLTLVWISKGRNQMLNEKEQGRFCKGVVKNKKSFWGRRSQNSGAPMSSIQRMIHLSYLVLNLHNLQVLNQVDKIKSVHFVI